MLFFNNAELQQFTLFSNSQLKNGYAVVVYQLQSNGLANCAGVTLPAQCRILYHLSDTEFVPGGLCLTRQNKMRAPLIYTHIDFIDFHLSDTTHSCT